MILGIFIFIMVVDSVELLYKNYLFYKRQKRNISYLKLIRTFLFEFLFLFLIYFCERRYHNNIINGIVFIIFIVSIIVYEYFVIDRKKD